MFVAGMNPTRNYRIKKQVLDCLGYDIYGLQSNAARKQQKFKYENIEPNSRGNFEKLYKNSQSLINFIKNNLQQMAAVYKSIEEHPNTE